MNYADLQKKNKRSKVAIIIVSCIMVVALAVSAIAIISQGFTKSPENWLSKDLPKSTFVLGVASLDELEGITFTPADWSFTGSEELGKETYGWGCANLSVFGFGSDFTPPEIGDSYNLGFRVNGIYYTLTAEVLDNGSSEASMICSLKDSDGNEQAVFFLMPSAYLAAEEGSFMNMIFGGDETHYGNNVVVDGYSIVVYSYDDVLEDFELVLFEKVA